jgi:hypothetical protein
MIPIREDNSLLLKPKASSTHLDIVNDESGYLSEEELILLRPTTIKV